MRPRSVWNHLLTKTQIDQLQLEAIQRRALSIIYSYPNDMPYINALYCAAIPSLADCREQLSRKFFKSVHEPSSCLSSLLLNPRNPSITTRLRLANKFPRLPSSMKKTSDIYFPCSVSLPNSTSIQPFISVFCSFLSPTDNSRTDLYVMPLSFIDTHALISQTTETACQKYTRGSIVGRTRKIR